MKLKKTRTKNVEQRKCETVSRWS